MELGGLGRTQGVIGEGVRPRLGWRVLKRGRVYELLGRIARTS